MDTNRSGSITWDEVLSHLLVELAEGTAGGLGGLAGAAGAAGAASVAGPELLTDPIDSPPEIIRSPHRNPIIRITFYPEVSPLVTCLRDSPRQGSDKTK